MLTREVPVPPRRSIGSLVAWVAIIALGVGIALPATFGSHMTKCTNPEEARQLDWLARNAKAYFVEKGHFPIGRTQALPPWSCCPAKCGVIPYQVWAADPVWAALEFNIEWATQVQYSYESLDGKTFRAKAVREPKCDGVRTEFVLEGSINGNGDPVVSLIEPPPRL